MEDAINLRLAYTKITGKEPTDEQIMRVMAIARAFKWSQSEEMTATLLMLDAYYGIYTQMPAMVTASVEKIAAEAASMAEIDMRQTMGQVKADLASAVSETAQKVASQVATKGMWQWAAISIFMTALTLGLFGWFMHQAGYEDGLATGQKIAREKTAAAAWATTAEGVTAYRMAESGDLSAIERCNNPGWKIEQHGTACIPSADNKANLVYGWQLPR